jgi:comEA protein
MRAKCIWLVVAVSFVLSTSAFAGDKPVVRKDINTATLKDLIKVKGIGKKTGARILEKREAAPFKSMYEIRDMKGIGKATYDKLVCGFYVKEEGELPCKEEAFEVAKPGTVVNINTGSMKELTKLKGIGKKTAQKIIAHREENGWFRSPHELTNIKGIGKKRVENLKEFIEVRLDINKARSAQFEALGFTNGDAIVQARTKAGAFKSVEDFGKLEGIDAGVFDKAKSILFVDAPAPTK